MGIICCIKETLKGLQSSDWINVIAIIVNSILAIWIVKTIQNRLTNKRVLKDHFINEIKDIRNIYRDQLSLMYSNKCLAKSLIPWFKLMNIKIDDIMQLVNDKYNIEVDYLNPYQLELRNLITENEDFIAQFQSDNPIEFSPNSKSEIIRFQQNYNYLFNSLIIKINDGK